MLFTVEQGSDSRAAKIVIVFLGILTVMIFVTIIDISIKNDIVDLANAIKAREELAERARQGADSDGSGLRSLHLPGYLAPDTRVEKKNTTRPRKASSKPPERPADPATGNDDKGVSD